MMYIQIVTFDTMKHSEASKSISLRWYMLQFNEINSKIHAED